MNITGGKYNSRQVKAPSCDKVRPTLSKIRESVFNMLISYSNFENSSFLDLFSGSGIISLEAISRGFKYVLSVEKNIKTANIIKENFSQLNIKPNLIINDAIITLDSLKDKFDVIYIDPPYKEVELYNKALNKIILNEILTDNGIIITESQKNIIFNIPEELTKIKEKTYGDTNINIFKRK